MINLDDVGVPKFFRTPPYGAFREGLKSAVEPVECNRLTFRNGRQNPAVIHREFIQKPPELHRIAIFSWGNDD
jgi:hypothetical protein